MARKHKPEEIIGKPPGETSEPRASTALYRSYPGDDAGVRATALPYDWATSIDTAQDTAREG